MTNSKKIDEQVELIRTFNRFYTKQIGLLDEGLLNSKYTLTEVRVLYELGHVDGLTATDIKKQLELDSGYLSRLLKKFENEKLISRSKSPNDSRQSLIALTTAGNKILEPLIKASSQKIENLLLQVSVSERKRLIDSMHSIQNTLNKKPKKTKKKHILFDHCK